LSADSSAAALLRGNFESGFVFQGRGLSDPITASVRLPKLHPLIGMIRGLKRLQLGCGPGDVPRGWINLDGSWNARLSKHPVLRRTLEAFHVLPASLLETRFGDDVLVHDLRKRLPFPDMSLAAIYGSHVLEHLYLEQARRLLDDCRRVLEPGGVLRLVVPDLRSIVLEYQGATRFADTTDLLATMSRADVMNMRLGFRKAAPPTGNVAFRLYTALADFHSHKWMWDADSLVRALERAGFVEVREMSFLQTRVEGLDEVEQPGRVLHGAGVCVEGVRPNPGGPSRPGC
jgi:SAM-dependent methyltransferase